MRNKVPMHITGAHEKSMEELKEPEVNVNKRGLTAQTQSTSPLK